MMDRLSELSDGEIALIFIGGSLGIAAVLIFGLCALFMTVKRQQRKASSSAMPVNKAGGGGGGGGLFKEQSQSVVRGDHPIAFVLPTISLSEPCSEYSDLESLNTNFSTSPSVSQSSTRSTNPPPPWRRFRGQSAYKTVSSLSPGETRAQWTPRYRRVRHSRDSKYSPLIPETGSDHERATSDQEYELGAIPRKREYMRPSRSAATSPRSPEEEHREMKMFHAQTISSVPFLHPSPGDDILLSPTGGQPLHDLPEESNDLGNVKITLGVDPENRVVVTEIYVFNLQHSKSQMDRISIRIKCYPDGGEPIETGLLSVFEDKILLLDSIELPVTNVEIRVPFVIKFSIIDKSHLKQASRESKELPDKGQSSSFVYGHAIFNLKKMLPIRNSSAKMEAIIEKKVSTHLAEIFSDSIQLSLCYEITSGKLTLGIIQAELVSFDIQTDQEAFLYAKITLFEGRRVIKAKKTRPVGLTARPQFHETFSILFPETYLDRVSCLISLYCKSSLGGKKVLGRFCIGPLTYADNRGGQHWARMIQNSGATIIQWHQIY